MDVAANANTMRRNPGDQKSCVATVSRGSVNAPVLWLTTTEFKMLTEGSFLELNR